MDKIKDKPSSVTSSNSGANGKPKEKRRSNEKRKEKCRDAARYRRSRETEIFSELAHVLPLRREDIDQLDKASIMRLSIAFLKVRDMLNLFPKIQNLPAEKENSKDQDQDDDDDDVADEKPADMLKSSDAHKLLTQALDGFLMILSSDGDVTYVSENISEFLGIAQIDILGQQIWEYSHQCDHDELKQVLNVRRSKAKDDKNEDKNPDGLITAHCDLFVRFKCTLTSRGRNVNIKSASYKVIHVTGHTVMNSENESLLISVCRPLPHPSNIEIPLGSTTFLTKHSLDMKFTYVDDKMLSLLGYEPEDLLGKSLYNCHHGADSESLMTSFKNVIRKGQAETGRYRFLGKCGGYSWIVTQATIIYDKQKPQGVVCVNYVISDIENDDEIYSNLQLDASKEKQQHKQQEQQVEQPQKSVEIKDLQKENIHNNQCNTNRKLLQQKRSLLQEQQKEQQQQQQEQVNTVKREALSPIRKPSVNNNNNNNNIINKISVAKSPTGKVIQSPTSPLSPLSPLSPVPTQISSAPSSPVVHITPRIRSNSNSAIINNYKSNFNKINRLQQSPQKIQHQHQQQQQQQQQKQKQQQQQTKLQEDKKRPKSVTASVFTPVPLNDNILNHSVTLNQLNNINFGNNNHNSSNNNNTNNNNNCNNCSPPLPFTKAQSVTASVLTPLSALPDLANRSLFNSSLALSSITSKLHMPRTEDMNKGFLMFPEDNSDLTMLKEDPDDLTHLAPTAGDACIPLDDTAPLFGEVLEGLILTDSYGTLLPDDINSLDSQHSTGNNGKTHIDPFINYRDESSDTSNSPHLLSPGGASKSPEASSLPSLCSPNSLSQEDEFAFMTMNIQDDIDLSMRAPYIPMNEQDDLPLLTDDLMWSAFSDDITLHKDALQIENIKNHNNNNNSANTNATISNNNNNSLNNNCTTTSNSSSTSSTTTNSNISNTESSLAALLCGNISIQHQQHQQQTNQDLSDHHSNDEKKFKTIIRDDNEQLVDPIDAFINNKSTNLECWTMNDLLQLNTSTTAQLNHEQTTTMQPQKQNIVINEVIPTTLHIPIVRINNPNKKCNGTKGIITNNNNSSNNNNSNSNNIINSTANISTTPMTIVYSNSSNNKKLTTKLLNASITSNNLTNNNYNTITTTNSNMTNNHIQSTNGSNCNITTTSNSNKRPSNVASSMDTKRVKGAQTIEIQASPQLLQQLMAPTPQRQKHKSAYDKLQSNRWNAEGCGGGGGQQPNGLPPPASNSVLKNLLVSGCDNTFTCRTPDLALEEGIENNDFVEDQCELSKTNCFNKPLHCTTSGTAMLRNCANPLIGGVGILPSPPMPMSEDDGNNPVGPQQPLSPCFSAMDTDSRGSADSGIECGTNSNDPKSKSKVSPLATNSIGANDNNISMKNNIASTSKVSTSRSLSFLDPDNPLCSSFLLDFCTDDYNMNEPIANALLEDTELGKVLSEWT